MFPKLDQVEDAAEFARGVLALYPDQMLAYNLSPSFNWEKAGMTDEVCHHNDQIKYLRSRVYFTPRVDRVISLDYDLPVG